MRTIIALVVSLLATTVLANDKVSISDLQVIHQGAFSAVEGLAHNNTDASLADVFVKFKLYNSAGEVVGNTIAHGQDIGPGETWRFSAPSSNKFSEAKLSQVQTY